MDLSNACSPTTVAMTIGKYASRNARKLRRRLAALAPAATLFDATLDAGPGPHQLFDVGVFSAHSNDARRWLDMEATGHHSAQRRDINRHDDRISTFCLRSDTPLDWNVFTSWLSLLLASRGQQVLRVKGLINVAGRSRPVVIHGVQHVFYPPAELAQWPDEDRRSRIVLITRDLSRAAVEKSFRRVATG